MDRHPIRMKRFFVQFEHVYKTRVENGPEIQNMILVQTQSSK